MFCMVFLGDDRVHPTTYEMFLLLEETSEVRTRLREQACQQPTFPVTLLCLIHQEPNESFRQALEMQQRVRCSNSESLRRALLTGNFRSELVALPGGLTPPDCPQPPPAAPRSQELSTPPPTGRHSPNSPDAELQEKSGGGT